MKKKMKKKATKQIKKSKLKIVNLKVGSKDRKALMLKAKKYAGGNLSAWFRHTGLKYIPKKNEKVDLEPSKK